VSIEEFVHAMDAPESCQIDFANLRRRVIEPAVAELARKNGLRIEWMCYGVFWGIMRYIEVLDYPWEQTMNKRPIDITQDTLLDIEAICKVLSISRSTLERLRGNAGPRAIGIMAGRSGRGIMTAAGYGEEELQCSTPFPKPSCMIGRSPRWTASSINAWLAQQNSEV
jgi:predicted DNA-binding transcriptional regulator AlpA